MPSLVHLYALRIGGANSDHVLQELYQHIHNQDFPPVDPTKVDILAMGGHEQVLVRVCGASAVDCDIIGLAIA